MNSLKIEEIEIGQKFINNDIGTESEVVDKTTNSVKLFNRTDRNNRYLSGEKDSDGIPQLSGKLKGRDSENWYTIQDFNKKYTIIPISYE